MRSTNCNADLGSAGGETELARCREYFERFDYSKGIEIALRCREQAHADGRSRNEQAAAFMLFEGYRSSGDYEKALESGADLLTLTRKTSDKTCERVAILNLGRIYLALNKVEDAIRTLAEGFPSEALDFREYFGFCLAFADAYLQSADYAKAHFMCMKAASAINQSFQNWDPHRPEAFRLQVDLDLRRAQVSFRRKLIVEACDIVAGVIQHAATCSDADLGWNSPVDAHEIAIWWHKMEHTAHYYLGKYLARLKQYEKATQQLNLARELARGLHDQSLGLLIEEQQGIIAMEKGDPVKALAHFEEGLALLETELPRLRVEEFRIAVREASQNLFDRAITCAFSLSPVDSLKVWHYSERSRARLFLNRIGNSRLIETSPRIGVHGEEYLRVSRELAIIEEMMLGAAPGIAVDSLGWKQSALKIQKAELVQQIRRQSPLDAALIDIPLRSADEICRALDADTCVAEFYVTPEAVVTLFLTRSRLSTHRVLLRRDALRYKVRRIRELIYRTRSGEGKDDDKRAERDLLCTELYERLLGPFTDEIRVAKRLYVIPHDIVHDLPFATLRGKHWLVEDVHLIRAASANVLLAFLQKQAQSRPKDIAVFANPQPKVAPLRYAEQEATQIKRLAPTAKIYKRAKATAKQFHLVASSSDVIHMACHAAFDRDFPLLSHLILAEETDAQESRVLDIHAIHGMRLKSGLVVLSACETGLSEVSKGEELIGLVQAFMVAGASSVIASLWRVSDMACAELMSLLYRNLLEGRDKARALNQAQIDLLKKPAYREPFFWSAFELHGDWRIVD